MRGQKPQIDMQQLPELKPRAYQADLAALAEGTNVIITLPTGAARLPYFSAHSSRRTCLNCCLQDFAMRGRTHPHARLTMTYPCRAGCCAS